VIDAEFSELNGGQRQVVLDQRDAYEALWASTLQEGADSGALSVPDLRVTRLALLSMCTGVAHWFRPEGPNDVYDISVSHVDLVLATTRATRGRRSLRGSDLPLLDRSWFDLALPDQPDHQARA
jgi:hypothetical protein